jgi:imidazoleglycerol-phosphate dehydratase
MSTARKAEVVRNTGETQIRVAINMDGTGQQKLATGVPFLDHMLDRSGYRSQGRFTY